MNIKKSHIGISILLLVLIFLSVLFSMNTIQPIINAEELDEVEISEWEGYTPISTKEELYNVRNNLSGKFYLTNDITFSAEDFVIKGNYYNNGELWGYTEAFTGTLDGNGYVISGLNLSNSIGFVSENNGTICNLGLTECTINSTNKSGSGCIAGTNNGMIYNCFTSGTMVNNNNSFAYDGLVGGIAGHNTSTGNIENCHSTMEITTCEFIDATGGIAGGNAGTIRYCEYSGTLVSTCYKNGGIAGRNTGIIESCCNNGSITGDDAGGIAGRCEAGGEINECYNTGAVSGGNAGGIVEYCVGESAIQNCYNAGTISADEAGGIAGTCLSSLISNCYNTGLVATSSSGAAISGIDQEYFPSTILNCYYKESGNISAYGNDAPDDLNVFVCSDLQMKQESTYNNFDFSDVWLINENEFPILRSCQPEKLDLNVKELPEKLLYVLGDEFDNKGMVVQEFSKYAKWDILEQDEYSLEGFDSTTPGKKKIIVADGELTDSFVIRVVIAFIEGEVSISGVPEYGQELTADISCVSPTDASLTYEWKRGATTIGTSDTYTIAVADIGQKITVTVCGSDDYAGELTSLSITPTKASQETPDMPQASAITSDSITVEAISGQEYRLGDDGEWQLEAVFSNLNPITEYKIFTRKPETDSHFASEISEPLIVSTLGIPATAIELNKIGLYELEAGDTYQFTITVTPENTTDSLTYTWASSDDSIVSVDKNGKITAVAPGSATITVTANNGLTDDCNVVVIKKTELFTVSFESNGGSSIASQTLESGESAVKPTNPVQTGYTFDNWYSDVNLSSLYDFSEAVTQDITLYAKWNINTYTVSFNSNGGNSVASQYVEYNNTASTPIAPQKAGHTFLGWYSDSSLTTPYSFNTRITSDKTLFAKWQINNYIVTFYTNGGNSIPSQSVVYGSTVTAPSTPTRSGYTFNGWYSDSSLSSTYNFSNKVLGDTAIYAGWNEIDDGKGDSIAPNTGDDSNRNIPIIVLAVSFIIVIVTGGSLIAASSKRNTVRRK